MTTLHALGELCRQDRTVVDAHDNRAKDRPYVGMDDVSSGSGAIDARVHKMDAEEIGSAFLFGKQHVLYGKLRPYLNKVATPDFAGRCSTELIPLLPANGVDKQYVAWLLRSPRVVHAAVRTTTGSRMPRTDMDDLMKVSVPLPPLAEQRRIAAKLGAGMAAAARARAAARERLDAAERLPAAIAAASIASAAVTRRFALGEALVEVKAGVGEAWDRYPVLGATRGGLAPAKEPVGKNPERYKPVDPVTVFYNPMRILLGSIAMVDEGDSAGITRLCLTNPTTAGIGG